MYQLSHITLCVSSANLLKSVENSLLLNFYAVGNIMWAGQTCLTCRHFAPTLRAGPEDNRPTTQFSKLPSRIGD